MVSRESPSQTTGFYRLYVRKFVRLVEEGVVE